MSTSDGDATKRRSESASSERDAAPRPVRTALAARALYRFLHFLALPTLVFGFRLRAFGRANVPRAGGLILAANHQSFLDPILVGAVVDRPIDYFARRSLFRGAFGVFIRALNALSVERGAGDLGALRLSIERLRAGRALLTFPEGTRTHTGEIGAFEAGVGVLARRARVPVIPVAIAGAFEAWPRGRSAPRPATPCVVAIGRPIPHDAPDLLERLRSQVVTLKALAERKRAR